MNSGPRLLDLGLDVNANASGKHLVFIVVYQPSADITLVRRVFIEAPSLNKLHHGGKKIATVTEGIEALE